MAVELFTGRCLQAMAVIFVALAPGLELASPDSWQRPLHDVRSRIMIIKDASSAFNNAPGVAEAPHNSSASGGAPPVKAHERRSEKLAKALRAADGYTVAASLIETMDLSMLPDKATLLVPKDNAAKKLAARGSFSAVLPILEYHVLTKRFTYADLQAMAVGQALETLLKNCSMLITQTSGRFMTLDNVALTNPDMYLDDTVAVQGLAGVMNASLFCKPASVAAPPPPPATRIMAPPPPVTHIFAPPPPATPVNVSSGGSPGQYTPPASASAPSVMRQSPPSSNLSQPATSPPPSASSSSIIAPAPSHASSHGQNASVPSSFVISSNSTTTSPSSPKARPPPPLQTIGAPMSAPNKSHAPASAIHAPSSTIPLINPPVPPAVPFRNVTNFNGAVLSLQFLQIVELFATAVLLRIIITEILA